MDRDRQPGKGGDAGDTERRDRSYNLVIPGQLYDQLQELAKENKMQVAELFRRFIKLGLVAIEAQKDPDAALVFQQRTSEGVVKKEVWISDVPPLADSSTPDISLGPEPRPIDD